MRIPVPVGGAVFAAALIAPFALAACVVCAGAQQNPAPATRPSPPAEASVNDIDGATLFATICGWCHEDGGRTAGKGPKLAGTQRSDEFILNRIRNGKPGAMPAFGGSFSEGQIVAILAYIRTLEDTPGKVDP
ncbi:MAG: cytochrome c [Bradyrhizobiaceae bacterium]|nr:cytochrome c [Bradyrhizobiaceae bacterium]